MNSKRMPQTSDHSDRGPLAGELLDLYVAMMIVVPLTFFLKSLWP